MKAIFGNNLRAVRRLKGWSQERAAEEIGVGRPAYASWEEGRAFPAETDLVKMSHVFLITDLAGFIGNEHFDYIQQIHKFPEAARMGQLIEKYQQAGIREKLAVNILLGLVDLEG